MTTSRISTVRTITSCLLLSLGLVTLVPAPGSGAPSAYEPGKNILGIYFDFDYTVNCRTAAAGEYVGCFLVLTNATTDLVGGWECTVQVDGAAFSQFFPTGEAVDVGEGVNNFIITLNPPLVVARPVVLMGINILVDDDPISYRVTPSIPSVLGEPAYHAPDGPSLPMQAATGSFDLPLATINSDCVTAEATTTWGVVKSLYR